ncbi:MAG: FecR family protein [Lachnospiraceae bacterium]|nr:FecR family protein [Lachnospiraceae bacterium]
MESREQKKKKMIMMIVAAVLLVAVAVIIFIYFRSQIRATTMRILRMEGEVSLEDNGEKKTATENLRLNSGNALSTATKSLVAIGLDDMKIVTLDELSRAEFNQEGRQLDLELTDGSLFFEVRKPLEDDEKMEIRTNTMVVGIRGTSGWVSVEGDHESLIVCDGHVHVIGRNPNTGETKEIEVYAGQRISTYLYNDRSVDSIMFYVEEVTERDLPEFLLDRLRENPALLDKVCKETGWDKPWILGIEMITPTPVVEETDDTDEGDHDGEVTPTPTPTTTPTAKNNDAEKEQEELEELLKMMLAMMTPTPTPTPTPVITPAVPYEDPYGDEEDEDEEEEEKQDKSSNPGPDGINATYDPNNFYNVSIPLSSGTVLDAEWDDQANILKIHADFNDVPLPINITGNGVNERIERLNQIGWADSSNITKVTSYAKYAVEVQNGSDYKLTDPSGNVLIDGTNNLAAFAAYIDPQNHNI